MFNSQCSLPLHHVYDDHGGWWSVIVKYAIYATYSYGTRILVAHNSILAPSFCRRRRRLWIIQMCGKRNKLMCKQICRTVNQIIIFVWLDRGMSILLACIGMIFSPLFFCKSNSILMHAISCADMRAHTVVTQYCLSPLRLFDWL